MDFSLYEDLLLLDEEGVNILRGYLKGKSEEFFEELYLATSLDIVYEVSSRETEELKDAASYWESGHAIPESHLTELKRLASGEGGIGPFEDHITCRIPGEELVAEPDSNFYIARDFISYVDEGPVLDLASGFGWIPPLLSRSVDVYASDLAYGNPLLYNHDGRITVEDTTIELFPDEKDAKKFFLSKKGGQLTYRDFAAYFWKNSGAKLSKIKFLQGSAADLRKAYFLPSGQAFKPGKPFFPTVTCFFGLNHIGDIWPKVIEETFRVLEVNGKAYFTLYREELEKFPVKHIYSWTKKLGMNIIGLEDFIEKGKGKGFDIKLLAQNKLYHLVELKKH